MADRPAFQRGPWQNGRRVPSMGELAARLFSYPPNSSRPRPPIRKRRTSAQIHPPPLFAPTESFRQAHAVGSSSTSPRPQVGVRPRGKSCALGSPKKALIASLVQAPFYSSPAYPLEPSTVQNRYAATAAQTSAYRAPRAEGTPGQDMWPSPTPRAQRVGPPEPSGESHMSPVPHAEVGARPILCFMAFGPWSHLDPSGAAAPLPRRAGILASLRATQVTATTTNPSQPPPTPPQPLPQPSSPHHHNCNCHRRRHYHRRHHHRRHRRHHHH